jgi:class 3 adenylate cyclase
MSLSISENKAIEAFAIIVDINGFGIMVEKNFDSQAQTIRDILSGSIEAIERSGGIVVSFMGDAFLAIVSNTDDVYLSCIGIARDIDKQIDYITSLSKEFPYMPKGPSIKIAIEFGQIDVSEINSKFLGVQKLFIGSAINYAARIARAGSANRCVVGPLAAELLRNEFDFDGNILSGPFSIKGKRGENNFSYYKFLLGEILWDAGKDTYWKRGD